MLYEINQFRVESNCVLPAELYSASNTQSSSWLSLRHESGALSEFKSVDWASRTGNTLLRSYSVNNGILVCVLNNLRMHINQQADKILLDYQSSDFESAAGAAALSMNSGIAICTLLQGNLALHCASVEIDNQYIGIMAPSGSGKSTLLWELIDNGAYFGTDDVLPVCTENSLVTAFPSVALHAKLSLKGLNKLNLDSTHYAEWFPGSKEFWIPIDSQRRVRVPKSLSALFVLCPRYGNTPYDQIDIKKVSGGVAISVLMNNTLGLSAAYQRVNGKNLLRQYQEIVRKVPIYRLQYYKRFDNLPYLRKVIREILRY